MSKDKKTHPHIVDAAFGRGLSLIRGISGLNQ